MAGPVLAALMNAIRTGGSTFGKGWDANLPKGGGDVAPNLPILGRLMKAWLVDE